MTKSIRSGPRVKTTWIWRTANWKTTTTWTCTHKKWNSVFVKWDNTFVEDEMDISEVEILA